MKKEKKMSVVAEFKLVGKAMIAIVNGTQEVVIRKNWIEGKYNFCAIAYSEGTFGTLYCSKNAKINCKGFEHLGYEIHCFEIKLDQEVTSYYDYK